MDPLEIQAILADMMSPVLEAIAAAGQQMADTMTAAAAQMSDAMTQAATATDGLQAAVDQTAASSDAMVGSMAAATGAVDANTVSTDANTVSAKAAAKAHEKMAAVANASILPLGIATAVVVGIGVAAVHMAGDFQSGVDSLVTGAGESQKNLQMVSDGILNISQTTGESTKQLIAGMFMIESSGQHGAQALATLKVAAEGAKVGNADLGVVADGTTTIMTDFASSGITATQAVNLLVATVANGKTHMQDLSKSLATILPTASSAGVGLNDVMGAMATLTGEAVPASQAATFLRQTILALDAPSKGTVTALKAVGLSSSQVATEMHKSLPGALAMITEAVGKKFPVGSAGYIAALKNIAGGSKQMQGILDLTGDHLATFKTNTDNVAGAAHKSGTAVTGWALTQQSFNQQLSQGTATVQVAMIKLGQALMPVATAILHNLIPVFQWMIAHGQIVATGLLILAGIFGGALAAALYVAATAWWAVNSAAVITLLPFIAIGAAIGLLIAGVILLYTHFAPFRNAVNAVGAALKAAGAAIMHGLGVAFAWLKVHIAEIPLRFHVMQMRVAAVWAAIQARIHQAIAFVVGLFLWLYNHNTYVKRLVDFIHIQFERAHAIIAAVTLWLKAHIKQAWDTIVADAKAAWTRFIAPIQAAVGLAQTAIGNVINAVKGPVTGMATFLYNAGQNLIHMLISGITSMAGKVGDAAKNIAGQIGKFLGFHSPAEEGPGAEADQWMPNLGRMMATGLRNQTRTVGQAARSVADALAGPLSGASGGGGVGVGASALIGAGGASGSGGGHAVTVNLNDQTAGAGFTMGMRLLSPAVRTALAQELAQEMARQGFLQGKQPIPYTGHN